MEMRELLDLLGHNVSSERVRELLARLGSFTAQVVDLAPEEGMPRDYCLEGKRAGVCVKHEGSGEIGTIFLMSEGRDGYSQFAGTLGGGLSFSSSPEEVRAVLGPPAFERAANPGKGLLAHGAIMRFDRPDHSIHVQFLPNGAGIELITLMCPQAVPGGRP